MSERIALGNPAQAKTRNSNIELFRLFLMFVILFHHFFSHGLNVVEIGTAAFPLNLENNINTSLFILTHFGVVGFMFISSYYGIKLKISKALRLWLQLLFYSVVILAAYFIDTHSFLPDKFVASFFPLKFWWFIKFYFIVMLLSPIINAGIQNISKRTFTFVVVSVGLILYFSRFLMQQSSFNLELLLYVYILGRYLRMYPIQWFENNCTKILVVNSIVLFGLPLLLLSLGISSPLQWLWSSYNIIVLIEAISCFYVFLHHKPIPTLGMMSLFDSANILAIYLITDHPIMQELIWSPTRGVPCVYNHTGSLLAVIAVLLVIMCICMLIDKIRSLCFHFFDKYLSRLDEMLIIK